VYFPLANLATSYKFIVFLLPQRYAPNEASVGIFMPRIYAVKLYIDDHYQFMAPLRTLLATAMYVNPTHSRASFERSTAKINATQVPGTRTLLWEGKFAVYEGIRI
jgi:hypothetical protein